MTDIKIGPLVIHDVDNNGLYDPRVDRITTDEGKPTTPDVDSVRKELRALGVGDLAKGVRLNPLAEYVTQLQEAHRYAESGEAHGMELCLKDAQDAAKKAGITVVEGRIREIEKTGYTNAIPEGYRRMQIAADAGQGGDMELHKKDLMGYAGKAGVSVDSEIISKIESVGYRKAVEVELSEAERYAGQAGSITDPQMRMHVISKMEHHLGNAVRFGARVNMDVSERAKEIRLQVGV